MILILHCSATSFASAAATAKPQWYRYYDQNGIANISTSVTPEHIRFGYEALDQNMQVIQKSQAYNIRMDQAQSSLRAKQAQQKDRDLRLKRAYGNAKTASIKRDKILRNLQKQIDYQQNQLSQLQSDKISFKRQVLEYHRKSQSVPAGLQENIQNNAANIDLVKSSLETLRMSYYRTEIEYADIIQRLKLLDN